MDYSLMIYGLLGAVAAGVIVALLVRAKRKKKNIPNDIYPMW